MTKALILFLVFGVCYAAAPGIVRPCHTSNIKCLRENMAANSQCNRNVRGALPSAYRIPRFQFSTPTFNSTYFETDLIIKNHHKCYVSEFFFNVVTDTAVIGIDCPLLEFQSSRTLIQHRSLLEDTAYSYKFQGLYPLVRLTTNLKKANKMNLCTSSTFADVTALPIFNVNPNDRKTANFLSKDLTFLNIFERETFYWRANELARLYINSFICDFGCNF